MKGWLASFLPKRKAGLWVVYPLALGLLVPGFAGRLVPQEPRADDLTVHEWGTFTAVAGARGQAIEWTAFEGALSPDVPEFVEHLANPNFKGGLRGTIRMETPVIYFYSPREMTVSVRVAFSQGLITEWYPHAASVQPRKTPVTASLDQLPTPGSIAWKDVTVSPDFKGDFPREESWNRYYAARQTSSTPLLVKAPEGEQQEKFLFYRGASAAALPLSARQVAEGAFLVKSLSGEEIPAMVYFERRGDRIGYRMGGGTEETVLEAPSLTGSIDSLCDDLERMLIDQGLYADEAEAMVATWRDSWFEEGSRLLYIVPRGFVDRVLPLTIDPAPGQMVRVMVGRLEIVTPATVRAVEAALKTHDDATLNKYGRFVEPILQTAKEEQTP